MSCQLMASRCVHSPVHVMYDQAVPDNVAVIGCKYESEGDGICHYCLKIPSGNTLLCLCKEWKRKWGRVGAGKTSRQQEGYLTSNLWWTYSINRAHNDSVGT